MTRGVAPLLLAALLLGVPACGATEDPVDAQGRRIPWDVPSKHYTAVDLPRVAHACWTPHRPEALVVAVPMRGEVRIRGHRPFSLVGREDMARRAALDGFGVAFAEGLTGSSPPPVELRADRGARWEDVRDVLSQMLATAGLPEPIRWAVSHERAEGWVHQAARHGDRAPSADDRPVVRIAMRRASGEEGIETQLAVGFWSIATRETRWEDPAREATRAAWRAARPAIRAALGDGDRVTLVVRDEEGARVPWGHVVTVFDVLLGLDVRRVAVPALDRELHLEPPDDLDAPPADASDDPVFAPLVAFLATFMVLFALAITLIPAWFERSARKRPRGP